MSDYLVKLIRDRSGGEHGTVIFAALDQPTYRRELRRKLPEEVHEYLESSDPTELADVLEVVETLAAVEHHLTPDELRQLAAEKHAERGGFAGATGMYVRNLDELISEAEHGYDVDELINRRHKGT